MVKQNYGGIINIGEDSVRNGLWDHAAYNAAKGGVHAIVSGLGRELAKNNITANVIAPPAVEGELLDENRKRDTGLLDAILTSFQKEEGPIRKRWRMPSNSLLPIRRLLLRAK
jgi:2,3-dihydroxy-2,3-dihydro-p-cumate dehydrogenase